MSEHERNQAHGSGKEPLVEDVSMKGVVLFSLGIVLLLVAATINDTQPSGTPSVQIEGTTAVYFVTVGVRDRGRARDSPPTPILQEAIDEGIPLEPPAPRLQPQPGESTGLVDRGILPDWETAPDVEMRRFLAEEEQELNSYGWVDAGNGIARVPIDRAMELIVEQGLPETPLEPVVETGGVERADG